MDKGTSIGIVEDDSRELAMLVEAAAGCGCVAWTASRFAEGRQYLLRNVPDILLVDVRLPDGNGLDLLEDAARHDHCRSLVISALGDEETVMRAIELGAAGYLLKDQPLGQIAGAIRDVAAGGAPISPRLAMYLLHRLRDRARVPLLKGRLTAREQNILDGLARGMSYAELAAEKHVSYHTINAHVKAIYRKLQVRSRLQALKKVYPSGTFEPHDVS